MATVKNYNWQYADADLATRDGKIRRKAIGSLRATRLEKSATGAIELFYHACPVVTWRKDGVIVLKNHGFFSATTARRIADFAPCGIYKQGGTRYNSRNPRRWQPWYIVWGDLVYCFENGMELHPDGLVTDIYGRELEGADRD